MLTDIEKIIFTVLALASAYAGYQVAKRICVDVISVPLDLRFDLFADNVFRTGRTRRFDQGL